MEIAQSKIWFTGVFNLYYEHLRNYLYYLSGDIHWSEDAVQEVFMVLWDKRFSIKEDTIRAFLFTVARNYFLKHKRHEAVHLRFVRKKLNEEEKYDVPDDHPDFGDALSEAISGLPGKCRTVFLMSKIDGISNQMIAGALNVSIKAVEKQITKALKILRTELEEFK